jgi:DNA processing protein
MTVKKLTLNSPLFPALLVEIPSPPKQLYVIGDVSLLDARNLVAFVGTRRPTPYGRHTTELLAGELARDGCIIVSGLALGIDAIAHRAALEQGGRTIAVLPCGLDNVYPASHRQLAAGIVERGGALISEYEPGTPPLRNHFIARNRIVSGLSAGLVVTEAAERSGTLHTVNFALEQGRTVMAVPGNINSAMSRGTNKLLKSGALPVTEPTDIYEALGLQRSEAQVEILGATEEESIILKLLDEGVTEAAELLSRSGMSARQFGTTLTMLELSGKIRPLGAGHWSTRNM